jgi:hypothetical protein
MAHDSSSVATGSERRRDAGSTAWDSGRATRASGFDRLASGLPGLEAAVQVRDVRRVDFASKTSWAAVLAAMWDSSGAGHP